MTSQNELEPGDGSLKQVTYLSLNAWLVELAEAQRLGQELKNWDNPMTRTFGFLNTTTNTIVAISLFSLKRDLNRILPFIAALFGRTVPEMATLFPTSRGRNMLVMGNSGGDDTYSLRE